MIPSWSQDGSRLKWRQKRRHQAKSFWVSPSSKTTLVSNETSKTSIWKTKSIWKSSKFPWTFSVWGTCNLQVFYRSRKRLSISTSRVWCHQTWAQTCRIWRPTPKIQVRIRRSTHWCNSMFHSLLTRFSVPGFHVKCLITYLPALASLSSVISISRSESLSKVCARSDKLRLQLW